MVIIKKDRGFFSLYDGLSAQLVRQMTYTSLRFHLYEKGKEQMDEPRNLDLLDRVLAAALAGCAAGVVGIPMELVNTRMQVNRALPPEMRWNYRNVFDGLYRVTREEGWTRLYSGCLLSFIRSSFITIGQNATYDQAKEFYMEWFKLKHDSTFVHLISSTTAACICAPIVKPIENLRALKMVDPRGLISAISYMMRFGPRGPFRGIVPCVLRMIPNTVITFLSFEQLRVHFGYYEIEDYKR
ncbi:mitochondrial dicarboxylate carrier isoform X2 [Drosophila biarmipes]|uniref:mitochondrial dicarboxylate carrier isoform X2 n=1 Tax=Drosophila biarmipes TaxID=125945 RepID=UPI0007E60D34|nr:mitochondrial dicarboxylate carrier isoform X2 [Drosophila biarmipes]